MGTVTITASGFAALPATAPAGWPPGVAYPGAVVPNGSRSTTLTDADWIQVICWSAATFEAQNAGTNGAPTVVGIGKILTDWIGNWFIGTKQAVQQYFTTPPSVPPPITMN